MSNSSIFYYNPELASAVPYDLTLCYQVSGTQAAVAVPMNHASIFSFSAYLGQGTALLGQSYINNFLGTTDEFDIADFGTTAMGTDTFAIIVNMQGQAKSVEGFNVTAMNSGVTGSAGIAATYLRSMGTPSTTDLMANTLQNIIVVGDYGNIAIKSLVTGIDATNVGAFIIYRALWFPV